MCPGSIAASEGIESKSSRFADEGTAAHTLGEHCFKYKFDTDAFVGSWIDVESGDVGLGKSSVEGKERAFEVTEEMAEAVQVYLDHIRSLCEGAEVETETKLDLRHIKGMDFGTGDFSAFNPTTGFLDIVDYKHGKGVVVDVNRNPQLMTYASGVVRRYHNRGIKQLCITIVQPRATSAPIRQYFFDALELMDFEVDLQEGANLALSADAPRRAGEWCKFCPAAAVCPTNREAAYAVATDVFEGGEVVVMPDPPSMPAERIADFLRSAHMLKNWLRAVEVYAHDEALAGRVPPGFKLVPKRATRKWVGDPDDVNIDLQLIGVPGYELWTEPELKSPAQVEALMPGKNKKERAAALAPFVQSISSGTNLVPLDDPRAPARAEAEDVFS